MENEKMLCDEKQKTSPVRGVQHNLVEELSWLQEVQTLLFDFL
jgi:hypothetical protein